VKRWEYKVLEGDPLQYEVDLDSEGALGWELVSIQSRPDGSISSTTFKREVVEPTVDFRLLLMKYVAHVSDQEGIDFINRLKNECPWMSDHEWKALVEVSDGYSKYLNTNNQIYDFTDYKE